MGMAVDAIPIAVFDSMGPFCQKIRVLNMMQHGQVVHDCSA
jgi:hypothetical protein